MRCSDALDSAGVAQFDTSAVHCRRSSSGAEFGALSAESTRGVCWNKALLVFCSQAGCRCGSSSRMIALRGFAPTNWVTISPATNSARVGMLIIW